MKQILQKKVARENFRKFSVFTGVFLKLFTPGFLFSRVKIGVFFHAQFHAQFFCRDCSRVTFRFTGAFLRIVHGWVVKVSREKKTLFYTPKRVRFAYRASATRGIVIPCYQSVQNHSSSPRHTIKTAKI